MAEVPNEDLAEIAYNCFAESQNWRDSGGLGMMMRWAALRDDLRMGWGKVVTCLMEEMAHRERKPRGDTHGIPDRSPDRSGAPPSSGTPGATGDPVPPGSRASRQATP